ncbi:hypothetical protein ACFLRC_02055 [Candidatus Altiarchaeota archaeon]
MIEEWNPKLGVRLDVLSQIINDIDENSYFQSLFGDPSKHFGLVAGTEDFQFALVTPPGENEMEIDEDLEEEIIKTLDKIMLSRVGEKSRF